MVKTKYIQNLTKIKTCGKLTYESIANGDKNQAKIEKSVMRGLSTPYQRSSSEVIHIVRLVKPDSTKP